MGAFGQVVPVVGTLQGFLGEVSRTGGGDPFILARQANVNNANNISFGDAVVVLPDATGGTCKQFADWQTNGGGLAFTAATTNAAATITPTSLAGLSLGMLIFGPGIPAGTFIAAINPVTGVVTLSKNATATAGAAALFGAVFAGFATREVKTLFTYGLTPNAPIPNPVVGYYAPGQYVGILVRGAITVALKVSTGAVACGPAYLRAIFNGGIPAGIVGGLESQSDGNNNILLPNVPSVAQAFFKNGPVDSNGLTELVVLTRAAA